MARIGIDVRKIMDYGIGRYIDRLEARESGMSARPRFGTASTAATT